MNLPPVVRALACAVLIAISSGGAPFQPAVAAAADLSEPTADAAYPAEPAPFTLFIQPAAAPPQATLAPVAPAPSAAPTLAARASTPTPTPASSGNHHGNAVMAPPKKAITSAPAPLRAPSALRAAGLAAQPQLAYANGPVERSGSVNYSIFWKPAGASMSPNYQSLINRYFEDIGGSQFYELLTQYSDTGGSIVNSSSLGGTWTDLTPYPSNTPTFPANTLVDDDIQQSVVRAMNANQWWPAPGVNSNFFVYTAAGEESCYTDALTCTSTSTYCAYHSVFDVTPAGATFNIKYANLPYDGSHLGGCGVTASPNNDFDTDSEISSTSHEHFEMVTDPGPAIAWLDAYGAEIGDKCAYDYGAYNVPVDVSLRGHAYMLQQEWSNRAAACAVSLPQKSFILTARPSAAGTGGGAIGLAANGIDCSAACAVSLPANALVTLNADPVPGSVFTGWSGACAGTGPCTVTMSAARDVMATFDRAPCTPRPPVAVSVALNGAGQLVATVSASGAGNLLRAIQFGLATNGLIDIGSQTGQPGNFSRALAPGVQQATFSVRRSNPSAAMTVPLVVTDNCGSWSTFVGFGVNVP